VPHWQKGVQVRQRQERGRGAAALHDPTAWTVGIIVVTGLALLARHPIARALGTEVVTTSSRVVASTPAVAPAVPTGGAAALSLPLASVPTHAPVDPFRALVSAGRNVLSQPPVASSCAGTTHRVVTGDTLWTIAARDLDSSDRGRVTAAWHRLYDANRAAIGADPSMLEVGATLCVPASVARR